MTDADAHAATPGPPHSVQARDGRLTVVHGIFHRGGRRTIVRAATVHADRPAREWRTRFEALRASGVTAVRLVVPWDRHAPRPGAPCLDGGDGRSPDALSVMRAAVDSHLDLWIAAGPFAGGVPGWAARAGRLEDAARGWVTAVANAAMEASGGRVAIWEVDAAPVDLGRAAVLLGRGDESGGADRVVERYRAWLRTRHRDDATLAREWRIPGLRIDAAVPPDHAWRGSFRSAGIPARLGWSTHARAPGSRWRAGQAGRLADWHAFALDAWQDHVAAMRAAVEQVLPAATFVDGEVASAGIAGTGHAGRSRRESFLTHPVARVDIDERAWIGKASGAVHDAAWGAAGLVARADGERAVTLSIGGGGRHGARAITAAAIAAIAEGAVAIDVPDRSLADRDLRRLLAWAGEIEGALTASTRLDDPVAWLDDPAQAGPDPDDLGPEPLVPWRAKRSLDRAHARDAYAAIREAGIAPMVAPAGFDPEACADLATLLVPTRNWIDLDRYGTLVVYVLRGGNLVAFPQAPRRQRDGTAIRTTYLWPDTSAHGGRVQVRDGTSTVVPSPLAGTTTDGRPSWIDAVIEDASPRLRPEPGLRVSTVARLLPDGDCLVFVVNPLDRVQAGTIAVPDAAALALPERFRVEASFATAGAEAFRAPAGIRVALPGLGAVVARLRGT